MQGQSKQKILYALVLLVAGILVLAAVLLIPQKDKEDQQDTTTETSTGETSTVEESSTAEVSSTEDASSLTALEIAGIQNLVEAYYQARTDNNVDKLNELVDTDTPFTMVDLAAEMQFIERYDDFVTYVDKNAEENFYIVYVSYSIYFKGISTGAPSMNRFVVYGSADETYRISDKDSPDNVKEFILKSEKSEKVQRMIQEVNEGLENAKQIDKDLQELLEFITK